MKLLRNLGLVLVLGGLVLNGCASSRTETEAASQKKAYSPLHYAAAREGLPRTRIWKSHISFGDINGDGFPDLGTVSRLADGPWIWKGDGHGNWTSASDGLPREPFCGGGMAFGDANKDGKMDVAIADHCKGVFVYLGDGEGHWTASSYGLPQIGSEDVAVGDFNKDGCLDLVAVAAAEEGVRAFLGDCKGRWKESSRGLANTEWGNSVIVADMNGDGYLDVIAAYSAGPRVWLADGKGNWKEASEGLPAPEVHGLYWGVAVGDLNGDGKLDIASTDQSRGVEVFFQVAGGKYRAIAGSQCAAGSSQGNYCTDDGDCPGSTCATSMCKGICTSGTSGKACTTDVDCTEGPNRAGAPAAVPVCTKGSNYGAACTSGGAPDQCTSGVCSTVNSTHGITPMNALGIAIGDLNKDGHDDLVAAGKTNMEEIGGVYGVYAMLGDGKGNFTRLTDAGLPDGDRERTWGAGLADIDKDGVLDIAVAFGDVLPPNWHSGSARAPIAPPPPKEKPGFFASLFGSDEKAEKKAAPPTDKPRAPDRGFFGSIEVWRGQLTK